jgi:hypothetical protein
VRAADDDPERVDDRHAKDQQRDGDLGGPRIDSTASVYPTNCTPLVPLKILAGKKFQRRNPRSARRARSTSTAISGWLTWVVQAQDPERHRAIRPTPVTGRRARRSS